MEVIKRITETYNKEREAKMDFYKTFEVWKTFIIRNNQFEHMENVINDTYHHMGSMADGSYSARLFSEEQLMFETDFLVEIAELPTNMIEMVEGKPGFYFVKNDSRFLDYLVGAAKLFKIDPRTTAAFLALQMGLMSHGSLLGVSIKQLVEQVAGLSDGEHDVSKAMARVCDVELDRIKCKMTTEFNGPATTQNIDVFIDDSHHCTLSFDVVICARLSCWPPEAQAWEHRDRKWPPKEIVAKIIKEHEVHLVSKPSVETSQQQSDDWRLTFLAEKRLIQEHTPEMRITYFIFKILFYKYFKTEEINGKTLPSYLAKTIMHWQCEELAPETWTEENIVHNVQLLLKKLHAYLEEGAVPNYFVPAINLLLNVHPKLVENAKAMDKSKLLADPIGCLPTCFDNVNTHLDYFVKLCREWETYYGRLAQELRSYVPSFVDDDLD